MKRTTTAEDWPLPRKTEATKESTGGCGSSLAALALAPLLVLLEAWAVHLLWGWFGEPAFGYPSPGVKPLAGLLLVKGVVGMSPSSSKKNALELVLIFALATLALLGTGYLIHSYL